MSATQVRIVGTGLFFIFIFLSGIWLSRSGKPFNAIFVNIHKLISLAAVVFLVVTVYQINQVAALSTIEFVASVATGLFFLGAIISGGLASIDAPMPAAILPIHQITPFLTVLSTSVTLYLLLTRQ